MPRTAAALLALAVLLLTGCSAAPPSAAPPSATAPAPSSSVTSAPAPPDVSTALTALESSYDARLGVLAVDTGSGAVVEHRADERFAYASTFKALAAAAVLARTTDAQLAADGGALAQAAEAAVVDSDNDAANVLLETLGGPAGLAAVLRGLGDDVTRPVRVEPELDEAVPGDERDTSTPRALAADLRAYLLDGALEPADRDLLEGWMRESTTGLGLVRAGVPTGWVVASKSGAGGYGTRNDLALVRPPGRAPIVLAVLTSRDAPGASYDEELLARATEVVVAALVPQG